MSPDLVDIRWMDDETCTLCGRCRCGCGDCECDDAHVIDEDGNVL